MSAAAPGHHRCRLRSGAGERRVDEAVQRLVLEMPPSFRFAPGQYLEVLHPDGAIPLSIASAPRRLPELHLHYQSLPGVPEARYMDELLSRADTLDVRGPSGDVRLPTIPEQPVLLVAGGTGAAQSMSFIDAFAGLSARQRERLQVTLVWCCDRDEDFYLAQDLERLDAPWLERVAVADPSRGADNRGLAWLRRHGARFAGRAAVILSGGPGFVYAVADTLTGAGVAHAQLQADAFAYAPRS